MDILAKKPGAQYNDELKKIIKLMTFDKSKLELKGSSSLASQRYFSDYDLFCVIPKPDQTKFFNFLQEVHKKIDEDPDLWFIELKLQTSSKKVRFYQDDSLSEKDLASVWKNLEFAKIDLVARIDNKFTEVSAIYSFMTEPIGSEEYTKSLENDIKELKNKGKFYKILKRKFSIARAKGERKELLRLGKIFNGPLGEKYQVISNLEAIQLVLEHYQDSSLVKKIEINLKDLKLGHIPSLEKWVKQQSNELNQSAKTL